MSDEALYLAELDSDLSGLNLDVNSLIPNPQNGGEAQVRKRSYVFILYAAQHCFGLYFHSLF